MAYQVLGSRILGNCILSGWKPDLRFAPLCLSTSPLCYRGTARRRQSPQQGAVVGGFESLRAHILSMRSCYNSCFIFIPINDIIYLQMFFGESIQ